MRSIRFLAVLIATVTLTACLNSTTIVKVKPDGSGTVEQTTLVNTAALKGMMGNAPDKQSIPYTGWATGDQQKTPDFAGFSAPFGTSAALHEQLGRLLYFSLTEAR